MIWKIAKKEFLLNLMTFKFAVGTVLCVVLVAVFVPVLAGDYQQRLQLYNQHVADNEAKLRKVKAYRVLTPTIYRCPQVLSVFSQGQEKRLGHSARIEFGTVPEINAGPVEVNPYLSIFPTFDVLLIFKIVMSALALLVAYDVVSREKEQGTLSLMLSHPVPRGHVLLGKLVAGLLTLAVPTTVAFIVSLLLLMLFPSVDLDGSEWARIAVMYIASLVFVLAVYNVGLLFSCLTGSSAFSLVLGLFFWVLSVVVIPNGSVHLARRIQPVGAREERDEQMMSLERQFRLEFRVDYDKLPPGGSRHDADGPFAAYGPIGNVFKYYTLICSPSGAEHWKKRVHMETSLKIKYARKFWEVEHDYVGGLLKQTHLARNIGRILPTCLYDNTMSALAGTDMADFQSWTETARVYRESLIAYIRGKTDNLRSVSYFTQSTEADRIAYERGGISKEEVVRAVNKRTVPLNLKDLPRFKYSTGIMQSLQRAATDLTLLVILNVLFFSLSFVAFLKYDVR